MDAISHNSVNRRNGSYTAFLLRQGKIRVPVFLYFAGAFFSTIVAIAAFVYFFRLEIVGFLFVIALTCCNQMRRHMVVRLSELEDHTWNLFTLYLRSFVDDKVILKKGPPLLASLLLGGEVPKSMGFRRLEEILAQVLWPYNPIVAIASPREDSPDLGAIRKSVPAAAWQREVEKLSERAGLINMAMGSTAGLRWEFQRLSSSKFRQKLVLLMVPGQIQEKLDRWRSLTSASESPPQCPDSVIAHSLAMRFDPQTSLVVVMARIPRAVRRSVGLHVFAYKLALHLCFLPRAEFVRLVARGATH